MTIGKDLYEDIIDRLDIGNSIAEEDFLLEAARVETPTFKGVLDDKYDIVLGRKGAGKTAIFRLLDLESEHLLSEKGLVILSGVNSSGESIFKKFKDEFKTYKEEDFENFWKLYFISLIYNEFLKNPKFEAKLMPCKNEINFFKNVCNKAGIPEIEAVQGIPKILALVASYISDHKFKAPIVYDTKNGTLFGTLSVEPSDVKEKEQVNQSSIYIHDVGIALSEILKKSGFKIWLILDRLDEVFDRYSEIEFNGLRGLLRAYKSFDIGNGEGKLKIKLFLRDDIKVFLTDDSTFSKYFPRKNLPPLPAATHIFAKESPTLSWSEDQIQQLILNRLLNKRNVKLREYLGITETDKNVKENLRSEEIRKEYWNKIFPERISSSSSLKWIFSHLKDSNDIVTPRSVIDMLEGAIDHQRKQLQTNFEDSQIVFPTESLKEGIDIASKHKLEKDVYNEFPNEQKYIKKLQKEGKFKLTKKELKRLFGAKWENIVDTLKKIGILRYIKFSDEYGIVYLFRPSLGISYRY